MKFAPRLLLAAGVMMLVSGCSYVDTVTGQTNNKVLPGQREDAVPGRPTFPEKPDPNVGTASSQPAANGAGCSDSDPACKPPTSTNDTFKDPQ